MLRAATIELQQTVPDAELLDPATIERLLNAGTISDDDARMVMGSPSPMFYSAALDWIGDAESFAKRLSDPSPPEPPPR